MADVTLNIRHNADQATSSVKSLSNAMGSFASNSKKAASAGTSAANGFKSIGKACLNAGRSATKGASGLSKFVSSIGRIAFYRAIRSAIRYVTDSFKQGLDAAYNWSKQQGGANAKLAGAMDALSAASGRMKLQLGAAFGGLITAIEPILIRIINLVTAAADAITRFFAVLNGGGYYKKAVGSLDDLGSAAGGAGKQVKGLLASWDELNVIGKESGGGGGGSNSTDYSGMYEWAEAESDWANLFASGDFFGIGAKIGDALGDVAQKITNFLKKPEVQNFGANLADALNGAVSNPENFSKLGEAAGTFVGTVVKNIEDFLKNVKWEDVKEGLKAFASGFKTALEEVLGEEFDTSKPYYQIAWEWFLNLEGVQRAVLSFKMLFNDIKVSWLELKENILEGMNDLPDWIKNGLGWVGFDISESLENTKQALADAKEEADALAKSYDELNKKDVTVTIESEVPDPVTPEDVLDTTSFKIGSGFANAFASLVVGVNAEIQNKVEPKDLFVPNSGVTSPSGNALALGITPTIKPGTNITIPATANYTDWEVHGSKTGTALKTFTTWKSTANYTDWEVKGTKTGSTVSNFTTWNSTANWKNQKVDTKWAGTTWNSTANWKNQKTDPAWAGTTWNSTANWKNQKTDPAWKGTTWNSTANWKNQTIDSAWKGTTWNSTAKFTKRTSADTFSTTFNSTAHITAKTIESSLKDGNNLKVNVTANITKTSGSDKINVTAAASGGTISTGQLFVAREAGPEMVGTIGNTTAVANNDQIVSGIANGVAQAEQEQNALLRQQNSILTQLLDKGFTISPSVALGQVVARSTALYGRA